MTSSHSRGLRRKSSGGNSASGIPIVIVPSSVPISPMSWYIGSQLAATSLGVPSIACWKARTL